MKMFHHILRFLALLLWIACSVENALVSQPKGPVDVGQSSRFWPFKIPARIAEGPNSDLFIMTLGEIRTSLADGTYDPSRDEIQLKDGSVMRNYYRDSLRVKYFKPIDKTAFPLPPSGWCSWYYYYQEIDEKEIRENAQWIAMNLKDFGGEFVQIDDGWQGTGHGMGENRDWTTVDRRFPQGMDRLAGYIKSLGLKAGIWLAPHGQSNLSVVRKYPNVFLMSKGDSSASSTWEGTYLVDPTTEASQSYFHDLFSTLSAWGYEYFKIDGQPIVLDEYRRTRGLMRHPPANTEESYRRTLRSIRESIGGSRYLLGCWGVPLEGVGIMNGSRTGGDVLLGWEGFLTAVDATMKRYYLHNIAWYCDPDVMLVRAPLTLDQARAWATLQGLTGQALMASDRLMDLSEERVNILTRVYPAVDIRPLDLFPSRFNKKVWDLKVNHLGRNYDVVGLFNFESEKKGNIFVAWSDLGLPSDAPVHVFDFWSGEYLGAWEKGINVEVNPAACRVLTLLPVDGKIQLISTSRHITQGWVDLLALDFDAGKRLFKGVSKTVANDAYELRFVFPPGENFAITNAHASNLSLKVMNHQGWAAVKFNPTKTGEVSWEVTFEPREMYRFPQHKPYDLTFTPVGLDGGILQWSPQYYLSGGCRVYLNGELLGYTPTNAFFLRGLDPEKKYEAEVRSVWEDSAGEAEKISFTPAASLSPEIILSDIEPLHSSCGWGRVNKDKSVSGRPLSVRGKIFSKGIGTHANSDIEYRLQGRYSYFSAQVGVDDAPERDQSSIEFFVLGDGKVLWRSGIMKKSDPLKSIELEIRGIRSLVLRVTDGGDGIDYDHADWIEPRVSQ